MGSIDDVEKLIKTSIDTSLESDATNFFYKTQSKVRKYR